MTLYEICTEISMVEEKLIDGEIEFTYDNLAQAMKMGHPADILDDILSHIGWDVQKGDEPSQKKIKETIRGLEKFQRTYNVDLQLPIKELKSFVK